GATLDTDMQREILKVLSPGTSIPQHFQFTSAGDDPVIMQLASALISAWNARNDGPAALESFNLFSSVAEKFFNLTIAGEVGSTSEYRRSANEAMGNDAILVETQVQIVRPWVEWDSGEGKRILIKALVKPITSGGEK